MNPTAEPSSARAAVSISSYQGGGLLSASAQKMGLISAVMIVLLSVAYAIPLSIGLITLTGPDVPIADPWFSLMELLILLLAAPLLTLGVATYQWAPPSRKPVAMVSALFLTLAAGLTFALHFIILTLGHQEAFIGQSWSPLFLTFVWPSVPYVLDTLAWDVFFAAGILFGAFVFKGTRLQSTIRVLFLISGSLSLVGVAGVVLGEMQVRSIGIIGYAVVYPVGVAFLAVMFARGASARSTVNRSVTIDRSTPTGR
jgi:hypothetical protein